MRDRADLEGAAARAGLTIRQIETLPDGRIVSRMTFTDPWAAARLLADLTDQDADDPVVRSWAFEILGAVADELGESDAGPTLSPELLAAFVRALYQNVQRQIFFRHERTETFQSARETMHLRAGDCDDHARLLVALARSAGVDAQLVFFDDNDQPSHAVSVLRDAEGWWWAETTIDARFGEPPLEALGRLQDEGVDLGANPFEQSGTSGIGALVTPGDVLAYRQTWDDYVTGTARAALACAAALDAAAPGSLAAQTERTNSDAIMLRWNEYAGWDDDAIVLEAAGILESFQDTVLKVGQFYQPAIAADCPAIVLPTPPTTAVQAQVIGRIEGLGILTHGVLQLLGKGAGGALDTLGAIALAPTTPGFWSGAQVLAVSAAVVAAALLGREILREVRPRA
jgi:hypothetical protein